MKLFVINAILTLMFFLLGGCQTIETRGQLIDNNLLAQLEAKQLNKSEVIGLVGTPTIIPDYSLDTWYYVERVMSQRAWFNPKVVRQKIVTVRFNTNNMVEEINVINDSHKENIEIVNSYTKTYGTELNGIQKFVRNFGRFNAPSNKNKKKK